MVSRLLFGYIYFIPAILACMFWFQTVEDQVILTFLFILHCPLYLVGAATALGVLRDSYLKTLIQRGMDIGVVLIWILVSIPAFFFAIVVIFYFAGFGKDDSPMALGYGIFFCSLSVVVFFLWPAYAQRILWDRPYDYEGSFAGKDVEILVSPFRLSTGQGIFLKFGIYAIICQIAIVMGFIYLIKDWPASGGTSSGQWFFAFYFFLMLPVTHLIIVKCTYKAMKRNNPKSVVCN